MGRQSRPLPYAALPAPARRFLKSCVMKACEDHCVYCGEGLRWEYTTLDHLVPRAKGGATHPDNLVAACTTCNGLKGDLDLESFIDRNPWAAPHFLRFAHAVPRHFRKLVKRAVSLALAG